MKKLLITMAAALMVPLAGFAQLVDGAGGYLYVDGIAQATVDTMDLHVIAVNEKLQ